MSESYSDQLLALVQRLKSNFEYFDNEYSAQVERLLDVAQSWATSWSGSSLGYQADVYYEGFQTPPPGAHFSMEWGIMAGFPRNTSGTWKEYDRAEVIGEIKKKAGNPDIESIRKLSGEVRKILLDVQDEAEGILSAFLNFMDDDHVRDLKSRISSEKPIDFSTACRAQMARGKLVSRDGVAAGQGVRYAPHQELIAEAVSLRSPIVSGGEVSRLITLVSKHIERLSVRPVVGNRQLGTHVFIGHGRSPLWRELKDFVSDRLLLPWDEFNRVPIAGTTNIERLIKMLDESAMALLVLTAEDERIDGAAVARQNVVHEVGLFQGRLGFSRAIVMLEEGCEEFSNINGLGQIRFPSGNIAASFEEVRRVLERENLID